MCKNRSRIFVNDLFDDIVSRNNEKLKAFEKGSPLPGSLAQCFRINDELSSGFHALALTKRYRSITRRLC